MPHKDRAAKLAYHKAYYQKHKSLVKAAMAKNYANNAERIRAERALKRTTEWKLKNAKAQRENYRKLRAEIIKEFGGKCSCCGEKEPLFLELDHIEHDGAKHRREIGRGSNQTYLWVKRHGFPKDKFQLLCANCNQGRQRNGGVCPHER